MNYYNKIMTFVFLLLGQYVLADVSEMFTVFSMYLKKPCEVGEIAPMSHAVGKELVKYVRSYSLNETSKGKHYLEAGGGCGAISIAIAQTLRPCDHLDVIEINPHMCRILTERLKSYKNVSVHCCSILDWAPAYQYDAIISTLPFLSLGIDFAKDTMCHFKTVAAHNCIVSCVEYPIAVVFRNVVCNLRIKDTGFTEVQRYMAELRKQYLIESATIYYNVPPINVYHLSFDVR